MKYLILLGVIAIVSASVLPDTRVRQIDEDKIAAHLKQKLGEVVDEIINRIQNFKFIPASLIGTMVDHMRNLQAMHESWIDVVNLRVKDLKGRALTFIERLLDAVKEILSKSPVQHSVGEIVIDTIKEARKNFDRIFEDFIETINNNRMPGFRQTMDIMWIVKECLDFGLDAQEMAMERTHLITGHALAFFKNILTGIFGWNMS